MTYKQVAKITGHPKAWRAVGNILNKNQDSKTPCHRVVKSNGRAGGYKDGAKKKFSLLKREGVITKNRRVALLKFHKNRKDEKNDRIFVE